jgi:N-acetylglutamate synthase-like GNAT family acetyltransferase
MSPHTALQLLAKPLADWERDGLIAALTRSGLSADDVHEPGRLFWRFDQDDMPVGFGGLEIHGEHALLRSVVTLPPLRKRGFGSAMVGALETEARLWKCRFVWLLTTTSARFFERLGYVICDRNELPAAIRETPQFTRLCPASATAMSKSLAQ